MKTQLDASLRFEIKSVTLPSGMRDSFAVPPGIKQEFGDIAHFPEIALELGVSVGQELASQRINRGVLVTNARVVDASSFPPLA